MSKGINILAKLKEQMVQSGYCIVIKCMTRSANNL